MNPYKKDFPFFTQNPSTIFLDSAASSLTPKPVIESIKHYYENYGVNIHRGMYKESYEATVEYNESKETVKNFINAHSAKEIIYTRNATEGFNLLAYTLPYFKTKIPHLFAWEGGLKENDIILISEMEHHANIVPWQILAKNFKLQIKYIPIDPHTLTLDLNYLESLKTPPSKLKIVSITHMSNVLGTVNNVEFLSQFAKKHGALFIVDGSQSICHIPIDVKKLEVDFFLFSAHKMLGPTGLGVLWGKQNILEELPVFQGGGDMILNVKKDHTIFNEIPYKFEAGTPNIAGAFGLKAAIQYLQKIKISTIQQHENTLLEYALKELNKINIYVYSAPNNIQRFGVISFCIDDIHPHDIGNFLAEKNIAIRVGHHCCQILMQALNVAATCRASLYLYNTKEDIDQLTMALTEVKAFFKK